MTITQKHPLDLLWSEIWDILFLTSCYLKFDNMHCKVHFFRLFSKAKWRWAAHCFCFAKSNHFFCRLVEQCWAPDMSKRPSFLDILKRLEKIKEDLPSEHHWHLFTSWHQIQELVKYYVEFSIEPTFEIDYSCIELCFVHRIDWLKVCKNCCCTSSLCPIRHFSYARCRFDQDISSIYHVEPCVESFGC